MNHLINQLTSRRDFLGALGAASVAIASSRRTDAAVRFLKRPLKLGIITDLHNDVMHDGPERLAAFLSAMETENPDAILQLGDFAVPAKKNQPVIDAFNEAHPTSLHVLGNHDTDGGFTTQQVLDAWQMPTRYYSRDIDGLRLIILDGNEPPPDHREGYPSHIGPEQLEWLQGELASHDGPILVFSHQPLAGAWPVDNAAQVQEVLNSASDRVLLALNGHSHIDDLVRRGDVGYLHVNSASYVWVGKAFEHESYSPEILAQYPRMASSCPYREALFTTLTVSPETVEVVIGGRETEWVGPSPAQLGRDKHPELTDGEEIVPRIRPRRMPKLVRKS